MKYLYLLLVGLMFVQGVAAANAGGSSAQIYETNVRDKYLIAGKSDQFLMSFTVESGDFQIQSLDFTCSPAHDFTDLKLMVGDKQIDKITFSPVDSNGNQTAHFGVNNYYLTEGGATELSLLVSVANNSGDFISACSIDELRLKRMQDNYIFSYEAQFAQFKGLNRLVYVDDPETSNETLTYNLFDSGFKPGDLDINSTNNLLMEFNINSGDDLEIRDLFILCDHAAIIKDYRLEINGVIHKYSAMQNDFFTNARAEHSSLDRIVFANLNTMTTHGPGVNFKLYGDTYGYFSNIPGTTVTCSIIDVNTREKISSVEILKQVTDKERNLMLSPSTSLTNRMLGRILLQVENHGEAWYVDPLSKQKYYLPDGNIASQALRIFGLGITNADLAKISVGVESRFADRDSYNSSGFGALKSDTALANRLKGRILLQVESKGEAWYVNPVDGKRYYLKNGAAAHEIMRYLSLGITNQDIKKIGVGEMDIAKF